MHTQVCIVVAMAMIDLHIVTYLETDAVAVVVPRFDASKRVVVAVLNEDATAIVSVEILAVATITIQHEIFDHDARGSFTG